MLISQISPHLVVAELEPAVDHADDADDDGDEANDGDGREHGAFVGLRNPGVVSH